MGIDTDSLYYTPYRRKPHLVEAAKIPRSATITVNEKTTVCEEGDYLVRDAQSNYYLVPADRFHKMYESLTVTTGKGTFHGKEEQR